MIGFIIIAAIAALAFAGINYYGVKKKDPGTEQMQQIASAIQEGARAFLVLEYSVIFKGCYFYCNSSRGYYLSCKVPYF